MKTAILKSLTATGALLASFAAFADTPVYDETSGYVTCKTKSSSAGAVMDATTWSDEQPPHSDTNYYVGVGYAAKTGGYDESRKATFAPSLTVAGQINSSGQSSDTMTFNDLRLLSGATLFNNSVPTWKGTLTVVTPEGTDPVTFSHNRPNQSGYSYALKLSMNVMGDVDARIVMSGNETDCSMTRGGDWSGFYGTYKVRNGYTINSSTAFSLPGTLAFGDNCTYNQKANAKDSFGNLTFGTNATVNCRVLTVGGRFEAGVGSQVTLSNSCSFGTFSLGAGSTISFVGADSTVTVTNALVLGEGLTVNYVSRDSSIFREDAFLPVFALSPACVQAGLPSLDGDSVAVTGISACLQMDFSLCYRDDPNVSGGKIIGIAFLPVVSSLVANVQKDAQAGNHDEKHLFLDSEEPTDRWSDGRYPHEGAVYYSTNTLAVCSKCVVPDVLIMDDVTLFLAKACSFGDLRLASGCGVYVRYDSATLAGRIGLYSGVNIFRTYRARTLTVTGDVYGDGGLEFRSYYPYGSEVSKFYLDGDNSQWSGKMKFAKTDEDSGNPYIFDEVKHVKLYVDNSNTLGGGNTTFAYDTIKLNDYAEIIVTNSATFANACRGVYVPDNGAIGVDAGQTARFAAPVTMGGFAKLRKNGDGTLVLGGPLRFLSGKASVEDPSNATNYYVDVTGGSLAVADCNALNGAKLAFSNETELAIFADVPEGDLKACGVRCDKIASPFVTDVPIRIVTDSELTKQAYSIGLVTVKSDDAESVGNKLTVKSGVRPYRVTSVTSAPGAVAGTVTFTANLERKGLILVVR